MIVPAPTPDAWIKAHLGAVGGTTVADLLTDDDARLRALHGDLVAAGASSRCAAKLLAGALGGTAGAAVAYAAVAADAGFVLDRAQVRWRMHPDGWCEGLELGSPLALVAPEHPWSGLPGTATVADEAERRARTVAGLVDVVTPLNEALAGIARLGLPGLWAEVADGLAGALVDQADVPVTETTLAALRAMVDADGAPWRARPSVWAVDLDFGTVCVLRKGGCCLAYTHAGSDDPEDEDDEDHRLFRASFPVAPGAPHYCPSCVLQPRAACEAQQVWWRTREHAAAGRDGS